MTNKDKDVDNDDEDLYYIEDEELDELPSEVQDAIHIVRGQWVD